MKEKRRTYWTICWISAVALSIVALSPLVLPAGEAGPFLAGMPRALWAGILVSIGFVLLTY